ncbi:MAG TPA: peptidoglycan DD-metalloendopeptidase family protein [Natronosporangium sp.]
MRLLGLLAALLLAVPQTSALPAAAARQPGSPDPLVEAVTAAMTAAVPAPDRPDLAGGQVSVLRRDQAGWAFGTAVQRTGGYPYGWLWLARREGERWRVALEGSAGFGALSRQAPVLRPAERAAFGELTESVAAAPDFRTGMRLPYAVGQAWRFTGGPHPMSGRANSSIDLAGGDGRVLAVRAGLAYRLCPGWLRVVHDRGFETDYYHLHDPISADGRRVATGDYLGRIGTDVSCGGSATGPHVHFSLRRNGDYVDIARHNFGKWVIRAGAQPYEGTAWHGSRRVAVGGTLHNYGALGFSEGIVDTDGGGVLNRRSGPGTSHPVIGTLADGATVRIECSARGTSHTGRGGYTTNLWNRLAGGGWVSDAYLWTGTGDPVSGWC